MVSFAERSPVGARNEDQNQALSAIRRMVFLGVLLEIDRLREALTIVELISVHVPSRGAIHGLRRGSAMSSS
jgi:hypothetical protein